MYYRKFIGDTYTFKEVLDYAADFTNYTPRLVPVDTTTIYQNKEKDSSKMQKLASRYYHQSMPVKGTLVEKYLLIHRGISRFDLADIRYCPSIYTKTNKGVEYLPGLLAFARNEKGQINHIQVTRLDEETADKTKKCKIVKQTYSAHNGIAINLNHRGEGDKTYYTEGVETGMSIVEINPKARVYAVLGKENFGNIKLANIATKKIILCVDNDGGSTFKYKKDGKNNIVEAIDRFQKNGFEVMISLPRTKGRDLNDILRLGGEGTLKKEINSLLRPKEFEEMCAKSNKKIQSHPSNIEINQSLHINKINIKTNINHYEITNSQLIKNLRIESQKVHSNLGDIKPITKFIQKEMELER